LYCCLFYIFSYHTFDFSAKKNFGTLKPPHENFVRTPLIPGRQFVWSCLSIVSFCHRINCTVSSSWSCVCSSC